MRIFISWSGEQSRQVAYALRDWMPLVIQAVKPWVSKADIQKGEAWYSAIQDSLSDAKGIGIFCLTSENLLAPWLAFEAGALSIHDKGRVATFLHKVETSSLTPPLSLFQATKSNEKADVFVLLQSINSRLPDPLEPHLLARSFEANWVGLEAAMSAIEALPMDASKVKVRPEEMLEEILNTVRRLERDGENGLEERARELTRELKLKKKLATSASLDWFFSPSKSKDRSELTPEQQVELGKIATAILEYSELSSRDKLFWLAAGNPKPANDDDAQNRPA